MATKKIAQTVITEDKFYTIAAANGKVVEVKDYNTENGAQIQLWDNANAEWQQWSFVRAGEGRQGTPLCGSACSPTTDRMQFGCGLDAVSLRLMQLCIQAGYSSDAVQKLSRHSRCGSVCGPNTVMNASECAPDAAQSGSARSPDTIRMRI